METIDLTLDTSIEATASSLNTGLADIQKFRLDNETRATLKPVAPAAEPQRPKKPRAPTKKCPVCSKRMVERKLEAHVNECLDRQSKAPKKTVHEFSTFSSGRKKKTVVSSEILVGSQLDEYIGKRLDSFIVSESVEESTGGSGSESVVESRLWNLATGTSHSEEYMTDLIKRALNKEPFSDTVHLN